jgi:hypothetical protein
MLMARFRSLLALLGPFVGGLDCTHHRERKVLDDSIVKIGYRIRDVAQMPDGTLHC